MENDVYYVLALFDDAAEKQFIQLADLLRSEGIESVEPLPHLTLGGYENLSKKRLLDWVSDFCQSHAPLTLNFNHIGLFKENVCFIAPRVDHMLLQFHSEFHRKYDYCLREIGYNFNLCSKNWVPHVTMVSGTDENVFKAIPLLQTAFEPFIGTIQSLRVSKFPSTTIRQFKLSGS